MSGVTGRSGAAEPHPGAAITTVDAAGRVLAALRRPVDPIAALSALLGVSPGSARRVVGTLIATSDEAERLLDTMPRTLRSLAMATTDTAVRCAGEVRGPVLWSETMAARASVAGDPGIVVCATPSRAFDTAENRVLVTALDHVARAAHDAEGRHAGDGGLLQRARHNAHRAHRSLDHHALVAVPRGRLGRRAAGRVRAGSRRATYRPAVRLLERVASPYEGRHLDALATDAGRALLTLLAALLDAAVASGTAVPPLRPHHGDLVAGPLRYRHPDQQLGEGPSGVWVGSLEVRGPGDVDAGAAALDGPPR